MLRVAGETFAERGYHGTSMDEVAARAGVTKPMVYLYFGSKESLYLAYIERAGAELLDRLRAAAPTSASADDRLSAGMEAFFAFVDERRAGWAVLYKEAAGQGGPLAAQVTELQRRITALIHAALIEGARAAGAANPVDATEPLAHAVVGAGERLANWWLDHPETPRPEVAATLTSLAWAGLEELLAKARGGSAKRHGA